MCQPVQLMFLELVDVDGGLAGAVLGGGAVVAPGAEAVPLGLVVGAFVVLPGEEDAGCWAVVPGAEAVAVALPAAVGAMLPGWLTPTAGDDESPAAGMGPPAETS
ncbi:hypothetical protein ACFQ9X_16610 [Catenulispora yoronensis]